MEKKQANQVNTQTEGANKAEDVDKALWFPTIITETIRRGCPHPLMTFCDQLPNDRKQEVEHKLEAIMYEEINRLTENQIANMKENIKFKPHYFEVEIIPWDKYSATHKYAFVNYSTVRENILRWLSHYPWLTLCLLYTSELPTNREV